MREPMKPLLLSNRVFLLVALRAHSRLKWLFPWQHCLPALPWERSLLGASRRRWLWSRRRQPWKHLASDDCWPDRV